MTFSFQVAYLSGGALRFRRSLYNKICDRFWLRYVDGVTSLDLNDRSTRALGHSTLGVRWNHLVLGGDQVPAWLGPPRGFADRAANGAHAHGTWESAINAAFSGSTSAAKEAGNFALSRNKKPSCGGSIGGTGAPGGGSLISDPTDSPLAGAKAAMYTRAETFGWFPASVITAPP